jgi:hypothetical protein
MVMHQHVQYGLTPLFNQQGTGKMRLHLIKHTDPNKPLDKTFLEKYWQRIPYTTLLDDFDILGALIDGYHIISVAYIGLTYFSYIAEFGLHLDQYEQERLITPINTQHETGTLFPKYNLTILPYRYRTTPVMTVGTYDYTGGKGFSIEEVETQIKDALKAETDYINSKKLVFDFRDFGEDMLRYRNRLHTYLTQEFNHNNWDVYMFSYDNSEWN